MKKVLFLTTIAFSVWACGPKAESTESSTEATDSTMVEETAEESPMVDSTHFGEVIDAEGAMSMADLAAAMEESDSVQMKVSTVAKECCQKKGCWMKVETADGSMMRVTFKDYGFFVPFDIGGKEIVMEGVAMKDTTSVEDLKHYAEDGGATEDEIAAITEPEVSTTFVATGVMIK